MAVTDQTQTDATYDGQPVEIIGEESHRDKEMVKLRAVGGEHAGAEVWAFVEDLD